MAGNTVVSYLLLALSIVASIVLWNVLYVKLDVKYWAAILITLAILMPVVGIVDYKLRKYFKSKD